MDNKLYALKHVATYYTLLRYSGYTAIILSNCSWLAS